nr:putative uncharacterized protein DDB_G0279653 [Arachis hypogaea]
MSEARRFDPEDERTLRRLRRKATGKGIIGEEDSEGEDQVMEGNSHNPHEGVANNNGLPQRRVLASYTFPNPRHYGSSILTPNVHANNFELKPQLVTLVQNNYIYKLLLFPFSLRDKASQWLETFPKERVSLQLMKTTEEAQNLIDMVSNNQYFYAHQRQRQPVQKKGVLEIERVNTILAQNKLMHQQIQQQMEMMAKRIDGLQLALVNITNQPSIKWGQNEASNVEKQQEQVQYMQNALNSSQNDFHGDTYNSSWRNHTNLRWGDNQNHWQKNNNSNHSRNTHSQNHSSNNTNQYKKPQNTYQPPHNNSQTHQNNFPTPTSNPQNYHTSPSTNFQQQQSAPIIPPIDHHKNRISSLEAALQTIA